MLIPNCVFLLYILFEDNPTIALIFRSYQVHSWSWGSSVSIVSGYRLDDRAIEVPSPTEARNFSSNLWVQTGSWVHPAPCTRIPGVLSLEVKCGGGMTLITHPPLVPRSRMSRSYTSPHAFTGVLWDFFFLLSGSFVLSLTCRYLSMKDVWFYCVYKRP
jgi:hypothetical protein